jgi:CheY-like chemotaxis protein
LIAYFLFLLFLKLKQTYFRGGGIIMDIRGKRILVVEDEMELAEVFTEMLKKLGGAGKVDAVGNAEVALKTLETNSFDLIFMDNNMPGMLGMDAIKIIRENDPVTKIIFMTAYPSPKLLQSSIEAGANGALRKPATFKETKAVYESI